MDIGVWLQGLGLGRYQTAFRENAIDGDVLTDLTEADFAQLGVALGDRKRLMKAIALLSEVPAPQPAPRRAADEAERRPITVMFCDLVGSTGLAAKLDAEDWRELVGAYLDEASKAVAGFGGHVLKKLGDGLMALFGYPKAQENDAERAARAALAILRALEELNARNVVRGLPTLAARIGLESGPVVVDQTGEVFGDAPNVAARVQGAAEPGTLFVTAKVARQVAGLFVAEERGPHELKGVPGRPTLYRIVRASGGGRRIGARSLTPLVGREDEIAALQRRWERARSGEGQLVQIVGEPGLGKSRLIEELRARLAVTPHSWVEWTSSQLLQNTPLHPFVEWGRLRFGAAEVDASKRLADLEATLAEVKLNPAEHAPLLAPLLDIPLPAGRALSLAPEELRRRQLAAIVAWLMAGARAQPLVVAFEDLHWADPTSLDLLKTLAERGVSAPLMIVATARPEFRPPWTTCSHHAVVSLVPLDRGEIRRMVATLAERHALSKETIEGVAERSGGVPLFVEEVTRLMLEGGGETIPPTLQQSLAARLDRLGEAREIAQIGAVLGREFSYELLRFVAAPSVVALAELGIAEVAQGDLVKPDLGYNDLDASLEKLAEVDLLFVEGVAPASTYRFKHALIQDAAYESLLRSRRQALHRSAAAALVKQQNPHPEIVAHHFTQSGQTEAAVEWWGKAGDAALRRSAFQEAISHLGKAIEMAEKAEARSPADKAAGPSDQRLKLQASYGQAMAWSKGFAADETKAALAHSQRLAIESGDAVERMKALEAQFSSLTVSGQLNLAHEAAASLLREAELSGDVPAIASARRALGMACLYQGRFEESREHLGEVLCLYDADWEPSARRLHGSDTAAVAKAYFAWVDWQVGNVRGAAARSDEALTEALASGHVPTIAHAIRSRVGYEMMRGDAEATLQAAGQLLDVSEKGGLRFYENLARMSLAWAQARLGAADALAEFITHGENCIRQGAPLLAPLFHGRLAELQADQYAWPDALASVEVALEQARGGDIRYLDALLHRIRGDILRHIHPRDPTPAEQAYLAAISIAHEQGARSSRLLAALSLATLRQTNNRLIEAYEALAPALEGFVPTPTLPQIEMAQALLRELAKEISAGTASIAC